MIDAPLGAGVMAPVGRAFKTRRSRHFSFFFGGHGFTTIGVGRSVTQFCCNSQGQSREPGALGRGPAPIWMSSTSKNAVLRPVRSREPGQVEKAPDLGRHAGVGPSGSRGAA